MKLPLRTVIEIQETSRAIKKIQSKLQKQLGELYFEKQNFKKFSFDLKGFFLRKFKETMEYESLRTGTLRAEFGLTGKMVRNLPRVIDGFCNVKIKMTDSQEILIYVGFDSLEALDDYCNKFSYFSNGWPIDWLWWFLFMGQKTVVLDYKIKYIDFGNKKNKSRSGLAIMVGGDGSGYSYHVGHLNPHFAGTPEDNWFNRTLREHSDEFLSIVKKHFENKKG